MLSRRIGLEYDSRSVPGFLLFLPIYRKDGTAAATPPADRLAMTQGWVYASIRVDELLADMPLHAAAQLDIAVYERGVAERELFAAALAKPAKPFRIFEIFCSLLKGPAVSESMSASPFEIQPATPPKGEVVLLAEDNVVNQKVARMMLERLGYQSDIAANGHEVIAALRRRSYDILLMDVQMPEMDGIEATRRIVELYPDATKRPWIIALTANAMQGDREKCLAVGMNDYISKPVKRDELEAALIRAVKARSV